jgi:hypothetical protein
MIDALFILCVGTVVVIVMLLEFPADRRDGETPGDLTRKPGILDRPKKRR